MVSRGMVGESEAATHRKKPRFRGDELVVNEGIKQ
jgi:hypothetical protein